MQRKINITGLTLFFTLALFSLAFSEESITITTYYPSPYGSYNELSTTGDTYLAIDSGSNVGIGTTSPLSKLYIEGEAISVVNGVQHYMVPRGTIVLWSGSTIPTGWHLCDGTNGTPDLRDRFVYGAGGSFSIGNTGGSATHSHSIDPPETETGDGIMKSKGGVWETHARDYWHQTHKFDIPSFDSAEEEELPPYYVLAYIMKA